MRATAFLIFFSIVLLIYGSVNYYIYSRGIQALPPSVHRQWFTWTFLFISASYIIGRILERVWISPVSTFFTWVGAFWLGLMVYFLVAVLLIDLVRLVMHFTSMPGILAANYQAVKHSLFWITATLVFVTVFAGYLNAVYPRVKHLNLDVHKKAGQLKSLRIAMASDIHMGTLVGPRRTARLVSMINGLNPDIILLAGDIVDEDLAPVIRNDLGRSLLRLKAPLGVYAITGNHEYIGGAEAAVKYLTEHGITVLRDTTALIGGSFYLAGRSDRDAKRFSGKERKTLDEVLKGTDASLPLILMDHQPFGLQQAADAGIDLQLSGHTHHGQLWPFNYITRAIYEVSMGYLKKGNTHYYVSGGFGGWGPPVRTNSRSEVVEIVLNFDAPDHGNCRSRN